VTDAPWELVWHLNQTPSSGTDPINTFTVNPSQSTSFKVVGEGDFDIEYLDGSSSRGDYFTDIFEIGGATLQNMTMGLGISTDISYGLVGVGYATNEAIVGNSQSLSSVYPNLPVHMVNEGLISTVAYSLWLNDLGKLLSVWRRVVSVLTTD
jgi:elongation factor G